MIWSEVWLEDQISCENEKGLQTRLLTIPPCPICTAMSADATPGETQNRRPQGCIRRKAPDKSMGCFIYSQVYELFRTSQYSNVQEPLDPEKAIVRRSLFCPKALLLSYLTDMPSSMIE